MWKKTKGCAERDEVLEEIKNASFQFDARSAMGARWRRHLGNDPAKENEYKQAKGHALKAKLRAEWAQELYAKYEKSREYAKSYEEVNKEWGVYLNYDAVVKAEGGRKGVAAVRGAQNYCKACTKLGGDWASKNSMTGRLEFLYMKKGYENVHREACSGLLRHIRK